MNIIDELSTKLLKFKSSGDSYTFRCPYCGDSTVNKYKTRGYLFKSKKGNYAFKCQNCGIAKSLNNFLKDEFPDLYKQYIYSKYKNNTDILIKIKPIEQIYKSTIFESYSTIKELHKEHVAKVYLKNRKLPESFLQGCFFVDKFKSFTNKHKLTYNNLDYEESRIVVPLIINGNIVGFQGRIVGSIGIRYITIMLGDYPKIYGIDNVDWNKPVRICEGVYDSVFIPNSIAMLGSDIDTEFLNKYPNTEFIFLYDNEKYNKQIIDRMYKVVNLGHSICIWKNDIKEKDINEFILSGGDVNTVTHNYFSGLRAKLEIKQFAKV